MARAGTGEPESCSNGRLAVLSVASRRGTGLYAIGDAWECITLPCRSLTGGPPDPGARREVDDRGAARVHFLMPKTHPSHLAIPIPIDASLLPSAARLITAFGCDPDADSGHGRPTCRAAQSAFLPFLDSIEVTFSLATSGVATASRSGRLCVLQAPGREATSRGSRGSRWRPLVGGAGGDPPLLPARLSAPYLNAILDCPQSYCPFGIRD